MPVHDSEIAAIFDHVAEAIVDATRIPGIGPKRARALFHSLGLSSVQDLKKVAEDGRIATIKGFGSKTQASILEAQKKGDLSERLIRLDTADDFGAPLVEWICGVGGPPLSGPPKLLAHDRSPVHREYRFGGRRYPDEARVEP